MLKRYDVSIKVVSQEGTCEHKHKVGDEWVCKRETPEGICILAFSALLPVVWGLSCDGVFPGEIEPGVCRVACADLDNPVVFELRRLNQ